MWYISLSEHVSILPPTDKWHISLSEHLKSDTGNTYIQHTQTHRHWPASESILALDWQAKAQVQQVNLVQGTMGFGWQLQAWTSIVSGKIMDCSILSRGYFLWKKILTLFKCNHFCPGFVCYDDDLLKATQTNKITQPHAKAPTDKRTLQTLAHLSLPHVCAYSHIHTFVPQNPSSTQLWPALCPNARDK